LEVSIDDQAKEREMSLRRAKPNNDGVPTGLAGRVATVTTFVPGGPRRGEVVVQVRGGGETYMAVSDGPVAVGCEVLVVEDQGGRTLFVAPL
jgi:membrane-bound ClpP family serine protease